MLARVRSVAATSPAHHYLGRYSVEKLVLFDAYQHTASRCRVLAVILFSPLPTFLAQASTVRPHRRCSDRALLLFLGLSVGFANLPFAPQAAIVLMFPLIKIGLKRFVWKYARALDNISTDVSICMVEISGSLYQTVCLQYVTTQWHNVLVMVLDIPQAFHEVHAYVRMDYLGDGRRTIATAFTIVENAAEIDGAIPTTEVKTTHDASVVAPSEWAKHASGLEGEVTVQLTAIVRQRQEETEMSQTQPSSTRKNSIESLRGNRLSSNESLWPMPFARQSSTESLRVMLLTRQSSIESIRLRGLTRQSSMEPLRSLHNRFSGARPPSHRVVLELRGRSVYIRPTDVLKNNRLRQRWPAQAPSTGP